MPNSGGGHSIKPLRVPGGPRHQPYPFAELHPTDLLGAFFICGLGFLLTAAVAGAVQAISPWEHGRWLGLHLAFLGGVSQLIQGAGQFFAGAFLAIDPPRRRTVRSQLLFWNAGVILLAVAVPLGSRFLVWPAIGLLGAGLVIWIRTLFAMRQRSLNRTPWATQWYLAAGGIFLVGIAAGGILAGGIAWPHGYLTGAHMTLNLGGWFGMAIVGTLHTFYPTLTRSRLRFPRLQAPAFWLWVSGVVALGIGYAFALSLLVVGGWLLLIGSAGLLMANVIASRLNAGTTLSLAARLVGAAQLFLPIGLAVLAVATATENSVWSLSGNARAAAGILLVAGWIGLTVLGSLLHLLVVLIRARDYRRPVPQPRPAADIALAGSAAVAVTLLAADTLLGLGPVGTIAGLVLLVAYLALAARVVRLAVLVLRQARPEI